MDIENNQYDDNDFFNFLDKYDMDSPEKKKNKLHRSYQIEEHRLGNNRKAVETTCKTLSFPSAAAASAHFGKFTAAISSAIKAKSKCGGYYWQYAKKR